MREFIAVIYWRGDLIAIGKWGEIHSWGNGYWTLLSQGPAELDLVDARGSRDPIAIVSATWAEDQIACLTDRGELWKFDPAYPAGSSGWTFIVTGPNA